MDALCGMRGALLEVGGLRRTFSRLSRGHRKEVALGWVEVSDLEYARLKLFQLSILWRCGVSTDRVFDQVRLGRHEPILRKMLVDGDPGRETDYGCLMVRMFHNGTVVSDFIAEPSHSRFENHNAYRMVFRGHTFIYVVTSHAVSANTQTFFLRQSGKALVGSAEITKLPFIMDAARKAVALGKLTDDLDSQGSL